jgi:acyl carrier protein/NAD(P)-dependent dehydrogenase (short-subunit alcohol dehydrogenase family)
MQRSGQIGKILVRPPHEMPQRKPTAKFTVSSRAQYLVVGGLGGFGFATAEWLATKGAKHLVLMSRNAKATGADVEALAKLKARGVRVELAAVDVGDRAALERYLLSLANSEIPLKGVFHAAMVIDDGFAKDLNRARIERVLWPKVAGAANLDELTRRFDLDCFVLFSSATVHVGNVGQASYVAANAFLEGLARKRRAEGFPALAVAWGAIHDVGYLARNTATQQALEKRLGRGSLAAAEALVGLDALLSTDQRAVDGAAMAYARIDWALVRKEFAISRTPLFDDLQLDQIASSGSSIAAEELLSMLRELPANEAEAKIGSIISDNIMRTLQLPTGEVDRNRPLSEFGMDSLMMLELRLAVEEQMGIEIPLMSLTSSLTVAEISKRLTTMLRDQEKALMSGQMSALTQGHIDMPESAPDEDISATAAAVARRAKAVDRIL